MSRESHNRPKDLRERFQYQKGIKEQDVEPTFLKDSGYQLSSDPDIDLAAGQARPSNSSSLIGEHFRNHWPTWLFGFILAVAGYFMISAKIDIGVIYEKISNTNDNVKSQKADIETIKNEQQKQSLEIQENKIKIENLEKVKEKQTK